VACLVQAYREHGHKTARVDPLGLQPRPPVAELALDQFGLSTHTAVEVDSRGLVHGDAGRGTTSVGELVKYLDSTYCGGITIETSQIPVSIWTGQCVTVCACMYYVVVVPLQSEFEREWLVQQFEEATSQQFSHERKRETLVTLAQAQVRTTAPLGSSVTGNHFPPPLYSSLPPLPSPPFPSPLSLPYRHLIIFLPKGFNTSSGMVEKEQRQ